MRTFRSRVGRSLRESGAHLRPVALVGALLLVAFLTGERHRAIGQDSLRSAAQERDETTDQLVELAPYMGGLQVLTHKLSLSIANENYPLASFYLYESLEALEEIKETVPEYRGLPIALLIDKLTTPTLEKLKEAIQRDSKSGGSAHSPDALAAVVNSCNQCHVATQHGFIKITDRRDFNPFNQDFKP